MTSFNRKAYIDHVGKLLLAAVASARKQGMANCGFYDHDPAARDDAHASHDTAFRAALDALYGLPREIDGAKIKATEAA